MIKSLSKVSEELNISVEGKENINMQVPTHIHTYLGM